MIIIDQIIYKNDSEVKVVLPLKPSPFPSIKTQPVHQHSNPHIRQEISFIKSEDAQGRIGAKTNQPSNPSELRWMRVDNNKFKDQLEEDLHCPVY